MSGYLSMSRSCYESPMTHRSISAGRLAVTVAALALFGSSGARAAEPLPPGCASPVYHRLDFWLGSWDVTDEKGRYEGTNVITPILGGCAVEERWVDGKGHLGQSLFYVDRASGRWRQVWVTDEGPAKEKSEQPGAPKGGLRFAGAIDRTTLTPEADGTVKQLIEGKSGSWTGLYKRIPNACSAAEYRQFDFWIGDWSVKVESRVAADEDRWTTETGSNHVTSLLNGCAIEEQFTATGGTNGFTWSGKSFSTWSAPEKRWRQTWVDDSGNYLAFTGGVVNGEMILNGEPRPNGRTMRMVFFNIGKDHISWRWEATKDGKTWRPMMKIEYTRLGAR